MVKEKTKKQKQPSFKEVHHKKLESFIKRQGKEWFALSHLKKSLYDRTDYGGRKFLQKLVQVFKLDKKKEGNLVMLKKR